jgi:sulfur carrier protein ThiS
MKVWLPFENEVREVAGVKTVRQLLNHFSFKEEEVVALDKKKARLITSDERLEEEMEIRIIRVLSGG